MRLKSLEQMSVETKRPSFSQEFIERFTLYRYMLSERVPLERVKAEWEKRELMNRGSVITLLSLFHSSSLKLPGESKGMLADLVDRSFIEGQHCKEATLLHFDLPSLVIAEECGGKFAEQLRGNLDPETDILIGKLTRQSAVLIVNILHDSALKLPWGVRKNYADLIDKLFDSGNALLFQFENGSDKIDYPQINGWVKSFTAELRNRGNFTK